MSERIPSRRKNLMKEIKEIKDNSVVEYLRRPAISISGNREMIVEGKIQVKKYSEELINFYVNNMDVTVTGSDLSLCFYNKKTMKITGYINNTNYSQL